MTLEHGNIKYGRDEKATGGDDSWFAYIVSPLANIGACSSVSQEDCLLQLADQMAGALIKIQNILNHPQKSS